MGKEYEAEVVQGGIVVASVSGSNMADVQRDIMHYFAQYMQDGPTEVRWKNMTQDDFEALKSHFSGP